MKKLTFQTFLITYLSITSSAFSQSDINVESKFNITASFSKMQGKADEIIYHDTSASSEISKLNWEMRDVNMVDIAASYKFDDNMKFNISIGTNIDKGDNDMIDTDWLDPSLDWSHRSWSNSDVSRVINFDLKAFYKLYDNFSILAGYKLNYFHWRSYGGNYIYSSTDSNNNLLGFRDLSGSITNRTGIEYKQLFHIPYVGIEYEKRLNKFRFNIYGAYTPFVIANEHDDHLLRNLSFDSVYRGGNYFNIGTNINYLLTSNVHVGVGVDYNKITLMKTNDNTYTEQGVTRNLNQATGLRNEYAKYFVNVGYNF